MTVKESCQVLENVAETVKDRGMSAEALTLQEVSTLVKVQDPSLERIQRAVHDAQQVAATVREEGLVGEAEEIEACARTMHDLGCSHQDSEIVSPRKRPNQSPPIGAALQGSTTYDSSPLDSAQQEVSGPGAPAASGRPQPGRLQQGEVASASQPAHPAANSSEKAKSAQLQASKSDTSSVPMAKDDESCKACTLM